MATERRDAKVLGVRLSTTELRMVEEMSEATGLSLSDIVRQAIRKEYASTTEAKRRPRKGK
jgi:hypothetical protein